MFNYGDHHLRYDMAGEISIGTGTVMVHDITNGTPTLLKTADAIFVDPPCSKGNLKSFYTKAELQLEKSYETFNDALFSLIDTVAPKRVFMEVFRSNKEMAEQAIQSRYTNVSTTRSYYYNDPDKVCWIVQGSNEELHLIPYLDEQKVIDWICKHVPFTCIADPCMGRGLVGYYANQYGRRFVGTELNPKRLAVLVHRISTGKL